MGTFTQRRLYRARIALTRGGSRVGRAHREGLPLPTRTTCLRIRPAILRTSGLCLSKCERRLTRRYTQPQLLVPIGEATRKVLMQIAGQAGSGGAPSRCGSFFRMSPSPLTRAASSTWNIAVRVARPQEEAGESSWFCEPAALRALRGSSVTSVLSELATCVP